jgi:hypothetical protein
MKTIKAFIKGTRCLATSPWRSPSHGAASSSRSGSVLADSRPPHNSYRWRSRTLSRR